ncbi:hypothetical protein [Rufibacter roseolus]|uniref:hypothetical protein n=1 Tax=Rufibacter roseolus TaxID=2817375 RepID=UPI001B3094BD|nr:hypothetical protein [Rufibacter roseolus]
MKSIVARRAQKAIALILAFFIILYFFQNPFKSTAVPGWHDKMFFPYRLIFILTLAFDFLLLYRLSVRRMFTNLFFIFTLIAGIAIALEDSAIQYLTVLGDISKLTERLIKLDFVLWALLILSQSPLIWSATAGSRNKD